MKNNPSELISDLKVLRTIHSNKALSYRRRNSRYLIITVIVAAAVTFIGFSGPRTIAEFLKDKPNDESIKLIMDLMTLSVLLITILGLIFRFEEKCNNHNNAVIKLSEFISLIEFTYINDNNIHSFKESDISFYAEKYKSIIDSLPPTEDKDYYSALRTIKRKKRIKEFIEGEDYYKKNVIQRKWHTLWI